MKKLMFAAVTAAVAGGAFALPNVYDYKASVKHLYLKEITVSYKDNAGASQKATVYQKYQKSTSLKGYLIMDNDGVTSPTVRPYLFKDGENDYSLASSGFDYGRNRGFLVVQNNAAWKGVRHPKILPAVLDAKWIDTDFKKGGDALSGLAEGFLYVGGDAVAPVRPQIDVVHANNNANGVKTQRAAIPPPPLANAEGSSTPGMAAIADYVWTSVYLFAGSTENDAFFNGPNWFYRDANTDLDSPFGQFEYAWDKNLPGLLQTGWVKATLTGDGGAQEVDGYFKKSPVNNYFHDTWMNGSGVGKWFTNKLTPGKYCCGIIGRRNAGADRDNRTLDTLSGNLKGGLFLCTENGIDALDYTYAWFRNNIEWEDQFNTARLVPGVLFANDAWQNDLWQDGFIENETTDVIYGNWSIKFNKTFFDEKKGKAKNLPEGFQAKYFPVPVPQGGLYLIDTTIWKTLYGAAYDLNKDVNFYDGTEIYAKDVDNRYNLPMITPQFAQYYRLVFKTNIN